MMADPKTVNEVTGFETPSTWTSKLDSSGGFVELTEQAQIQLIFPLIKVPEVFVNTAALARGVSVLGTGSTSSAKPKTADTATRKMGVWKETKLTLIIIGELQALFVAVHDVWQFHALLLYREQRREGSDRGGKIVCSKWLGDCLSGEMPVKLQGI